MYSVSVPAGQQRVHGVRGREPEGRPARAAEGLEDLLQDFVGTVGGPDVLRGPARGRGIRPALPQFGEFAVRVAVQPGGRGAHGLGDGCADIGRDAMGVLVDVQQDGDVQLGRAVGLSPRRLVRRGSRFRRSSWSVTCVQAEAVRPRPGLELGRAAAARITGRRQCVDGHEADCWPGWTLCGVQVIQLDDVRRRRHGGRAPGPTAPADGPERLPRLDRDGNGRASERSARRVSGLGGALRKPTKVRGDGRGKHERQADQKTNRPRRVSRRGAVGAEVCGLARAQLRRNMVPDLLADILVNTMLSTGPSIIEPLCVDT